MKKIMRAICAAAMFLASGAALAETYRDSSAYVARRVYAASDDYLFIERPEVSRLKVFYISGHAGYMIPASVDANDKGGCTSYVGGVFCNEGVNTPAGAKARFSDRTFVMAGIGFNTATLFRFDAEWFRVVSGANMSGDWDAYVNSSGRERNLQLASRAEIEGATVNAYLDLVSDRTQPEWLVVPYVMGGIGRSSVSLGDISIARDDGQNFSIAGKNQKATTFVLGAGLTIGINSYIAIDAGYRFYNFGNASPAKSIQSGGSSYPLDLEMELKAHIATLGLRLQI